MKQKAISVWSPEGILATGREGLARVTGSTSLQEFVESSILLGCAYFGAKAGQKLTPGHAEAVFGGALTGMVGYKLATTMGGTPPAAQIAGLGILASIGVIDWNPLEAIQEFEGKVQMQRDSAIDTACKECKRQGGICYGPGQDDVAPRSPFVKCVFHDGSVKWIKW